LGKQGFGDDVWVKNIEFSFEDAIVPQHVISETAERLRPEIKNMATAISEDYATNFICQ